MLSIHKSRKTVNDAKLMTGCFLVWKKDSKNFSGNRITGHLLKQGQNCITAAYFMAKAYLSNSEFSNHISRKSFIVKKGSKYLGVKNGELKLFSTIDFAIFFLSEKSLKSFIDYAIIDTRNAKVIGNSYGIVSITKR